MVYDVVEDSTILSNLYGVLFNMLDILVIRWEIFKGVNLRILLMIQDKSMLSTSIYHQKKARETLSSPGLVSLPLPRARSTPRLT